MKTSEEILKLGKCSAFQINTTSMTDQEVILAL